MGNGTAGRNQMQFMALVDESVLDRMDALRVATGVSRAEINRKALAGTPLSAQENDASEELYRLDDLVTRATDGTTGQFVRALVAGRKAGIPTLNELEAMSNERIREQIAPR